VGQVVGLVIKLEIKNMLGEMYLSFGHHCATLLSS